MMGAAKTRLGDIAKIVRGVNYKKPQARTDPALGHLPLLRATNIAKALNFENLLYVPETVVKSEQRLRRGDIVLAASSGSLNVVGKAARLKQDWEGTFGAFCYVVRPDQTKVRSRYLELFMQTSEYGKRVSQLAAGTNINNLKREHIESFEFPAIDLMEQDSLVAEVDKQFTRLDVAEKVLVGAQTKMDRYRASVLWAACTGQPFDAKRWITQADSVELDLPAAWKWKTLGELCPVFVDSAHRTPKPSEAGFPALRPRDVVRGKLDVLGAVKVDETEYALQTQRRVPQADDIVYSRELSYGWAVAVPEDTKLCLGQGMVLFRPGAEVSMSYLVHFLNGPLGRRQAKAAATGTAHPHVNLTEIRKFAIAVPPRDEQDAIVQEIERRLSVLDETELIVDLARKRANALRQSILGQAFSGTFLERPERRKPGARNQGAVS